MGNGTLEDESKELEPECPLGVRATAWLIIGLVGLWVAMIVAFAAFDGPVIDPWSLKNAALTVLALLLIGVWVVAAVRLLRGHLWAYYTTLALSGLTAASSLAESIRSRHWLLLELDLIVPAVSFALLLVGRKGYLAFARHRAVVGRETEPEAVG